MIRIARGSVSFQRDLKAGDDLDEDTDFSSRPADITVLGGDGSDFLSGQGYGGRLPSLSQSHPLGRRRRTTRSSAASSGDHLFGEAGNDTLRSVDLADVHRDRRLRLR